MYFGLSKPYIAKLKSDETGYTDGFKCGKATATSITPSQNEKEVYGDNEIAEYVSIFKNAEVTLETTTIPQAGIPVMYGHEVDTLNKKVIYKKNDRPNYVGFGFVIAELIDGVTSYTATVLYKVRFTEQGVSYVTSGDTIELKAAALKGIAYSLSGANGVWQNVKTFATEELAEAYVKGELDITPKCTSPVADLASGTYSGPQTVTLTAGAGETIHYTTNGFEPTSASTTYSTAVPVAEDTILKAIAVKVGSADSDVSTYQYVITA